MSLKLGQLYIDYNRALLFILFGFFYMNFFDFSQYKQTDRHTRHYFFCLDYKQYLCRNIIQKINKTQRIIGTELELK